MIIATEMQLNFPQMGHSFLSFFFLASSQLGLFIHIVLRPIALFEIMQHVKEITQSLTYNRLATNLMVTSLTPKQGAIKWTWKGDERKQQPKRNICQCRFQCQFVSGMFLMSGPTFTKSDFIIPLLVVTRCEPRTWTAGRCTVAIFIRSKLERKKKKKRCPREVIQPPLCPNIQLVAHVPLLTWLFRGALSAPLM